MKIIKNENRLETLLKRYEIPQHFRYFEKYRPYVHLVSFEKNEVLYQKDFQRQYLIFFLSGKIRICSSLSNGKTLLVCFYTSFQLLGDLEFFDMDTLATAPQAVEHCTCITLQITEIRSLLLKDDLFLQFLARSLAGKLAASTRNNSINLLYPLENKLASYIYQASDGQVFSENLTHLAELLGTSYRHLLRVMRSFQEQGILSRTEAGYTIIDSGRLKELAQDLYLT